MAGADLGKYGVQLGIAAPRFVMGKDQLPGVRRCSLFDSRLVSAMSPTHFSGILLLGIGGIDNQHIDIGHRLCHPQQLAIDDFLIRLTPCLPVRRY